MSPSYDPNPFQYLRDRASGRIGAGAAIAGGGGGGPSGLPLTAPFAFGDNSYGAQTGNINVSQWTWMAMGCRGLPTRGNNQSRGGDRQGPHLLDRIAPLKSCANNGVATFMNWQNDLADAAVTNDNAGGDLLLSRLDALISQITSVGGKAVFYNQGNTTSAISKGAAVARAKSGLAARNVLVIDDPVDYQDANQSTDQTHPDKSGAARALGEARGNAIRTLFNTASIFDAGSGQLTGNFNANWNMGGTAPALTNNSGGAASQAMDVSRILPGSVAARKLSLTGTVTADPTSAGSTGDVQLRFSTPHQAGTNTYGKSPIAIMWIEITDSAGNDPVGLASIQIQCGQSTAFGKQYVTSHGPWGGGKKYQGPIGIIQPTRISAQSLPMNTDIIIRGLQGTVDIEVRISYLNVLYTDETAYGPKANASLIFTSGRPLLRAVPTTAPTSGPLAVGGTLGVGTVLSSIFGGGITETYDAIRGGVTDVGDIVPPTAAGAAVPYTVQAGDSGSNLLMRVNAASAWPGDPNLSVDTAALAVT